MPILTRKLPFDARSLPRGWWSGSWALAMPLGLLLLGAPPAAACDWWGCPTGTYAYRPSPRTYAERSPRYARRYFRPAWAYGYTSPARAEGYAYSPWPSSAIPPRRWYARTALQVP